MASKRRGRNLKHMAVPGVIAVACVVILFVVQPPSGNGVIRAAALLGYMSVFLAILSSAYLRELVRHFGQPFIMTHHMVSITGLVLLTLHPIAVSLTRKDMKVLVPRFDSVTAFFTWGGPPAWLLLALGTAAVLLRVRFKKGWRAVHSLNRVAFLLGTVHAILLGTDGELLGVRIVAIIMVAATAYAFIRRRGIAKARAQARAPR